MTNLVHAGLAAPVGLRDLDRIYFVPLIVLLVLLVEREIIRAAGSRGARIAIRILDVAILPLLVAFIILVVLRVDQVLTNG